MCVCVCCSKGGKDRAWKEGRKEDKKEEEGNGGRKEGRNGEREEGREEGKKEEREEGRKEGGDVLQRTRIPAPTETSGICECGLGKWKVVK